jgi:AhpD family alkylhydroperoxidase
MAILVAQPAARFSGLAYTTRQIEREFPLFAHLAALQHHPELLAASWALLRESIVAAGDRAEAEHIAGVISKANRCGYLTALHAAVLTGMGQFGTAWELVAGRPGSRRNTTFLKSGDTRNEILAAQFFSRLARVLAPGQISFSELWLGYRVGRESSGGFLAVRPGRNAACHAHGYGSPPGRFDCH